MTAKKKKLIKGLVAVALIAIIGIGATLAYLSATTNKAENKFTSDAKITGTLTETSWTDEEWSKFQPGDSHGKNPVVNLGAGSEDAYVGMLITCKNGSDTNATVISMDDFTKNYATVSYKGTTGINPNWIHVGYYEGIGDFYVYKNNVDASKSTTDVPTDAIFDTVTVNAGVNQKWSASAATETVYTYTDVDGDGKYTAGTDKDLKEVDQTTTNYDPTVTYTDANGKVLTGLSKQITMPHFELDAQGFAVQTANLTLDTSTSTPTGTALTQLLKLAGIK